MPDKPDMHVLDANGKPVTDATAPDGNAATQAPEVDMEALNDEMASMLADARVQLLGSVLVLGDQLMSWAANYILTDVQYSREARAAMMQVLGSALGNADGTPRAFSEEVMAHELEAALPAIQQRVAENVANAEKAQAAAAAESVEPDTPVNA